MVNITLDKNYTFPSFGIGPLLSFVAYVIILIPGLWTFWRWKHQEPIKSRGADLVIYNFCFFLCYYAVFAVNLYLGSGSFSSINPVVTCHLEFWLAHMFLPMGFFPYLLRALRLYVLHWSGVITVVDASLNLNPEEIASSTALMIKDTMVTKPRAFQRFLVKYANWLISSTGLFVALSGVVLLSFIISLVIYFGDLAQASQSGEPFCNTNIAGTILILIQGISMILMIIAVTVMLWTVSDAQIFKIELMACVCVCIPIFILWATFDLVTIPNVYPVESVYFVFALSWVLYFISVVFPIYKVWERRREVILLEQGTSGSTSSTIRLDNVSDRSTRASSEELSLNRVSTFSNRVKNAAGVVRPLLQNEVNLNSLLKAAVDCFSVEMVLFCLQVEAFRTTMLKTTNEEASTRSSSDMLVARIVDTYISTGAKRELNLVNETRSQILKACEQSKFDMTLFDQAEAETMELLYRNVLPRMNPATLTP